MVLINNSNNEKLEALARDAFESKYRISSLNSELNHLKFTLESIKGNDRLYIHLNKVKVNHRIQAWEGLLEQSEQDYQECLDEINDFLRGLDITEDFERYFKHIGNSYFTFEFKDGKSAITNNPKKRMH